MKDQRFDGVEFEHLVDDFDRAVPVGLYRYGPDGAEVMIVPPRDTKVQSTDEIILVSTDLGAAGHHTARDLALDSIGAGKLSLKAVREPPRSIVVIGWNGRIVALIEELQRQSEGHLRVVSLSAMPVEEREKRLRGNSGEDLTLELIEGSPSNPADLERVISDANPEAIVVMSSEVVANPRSADAQALICHLHLETLLGEKATPIIVELFYPEDAGDFQTRATTDILATDSMISYFLSQVALRPEIADVYDALLGGAALSLARLEGLPAAGLPFVVIYHAVLAQGAVPVGYLDADRRPHLVPADEDIIPPGVELVLINHHTHRSDN